MGGLQGNAQASGELESSCFESQHTPGSHLQFAAAVEIIQRHGTFDDDHLIDLQQLAILLVRLGEQRHFDARRAVVQRDHRHGVATLALDLPHLVDEPGQQLHPLFCLEVADTGTNEATQFRQIGRDRMSRKVKPKRVFLFLQAALVAPRADVTEIGINVAARHRGDQLPEQVADTTLLPLAVLLCGLHRFGEAGQQHGTIGPEIVARTGANQSFDGTLVDQAGIHALA